MGGLWNERLDRILTNKTPNRGHLRVLSIVCFIPQKEIAMLEAILKVIVLVIAAVILAGAMWLLLDIAAENSSAKLARKIEERKRHVKSNRV